MDIKITLPDEKKNYLTLKRMDLLEKRFYQQYDRFNKKIDELEKAIKNFPTPKISLNTNNLTKSFNKLFERLEKAIKASRPRLIPSPS